MNIKDKKQRTLFMSIAAGIILLAVGLGLLCVRFYSEINQMTELRKNVMQENLAARNLLTAKHGSWTDAKLISPMKVDVLIDTLIKIAGQNNVDLTVLTPPSVVKETAKKKNYYQRIIFDMEARASFKDFGLFLAAVRDTPEGIVDINGLHVGPDDLNSQHIKARITFMLFVDINNG
ncbi:MAG: hypothetical protein HQL24_04455 [Candidatus Omnitrophica bacterium]|nr:hypothetical protein [Candidatus Omnitrophota bacterium]